MSNEEWNETRIDVVGQNGNTADHYDVLCEICGKEKAKVTECGREGCSNGIL